MSRCVPSLAAAIVLANLTACSGSRPARPAVVANISGISRGTGGMAARAVIDGTITYHDSTNHVMFVQDATGGAQVELAPNQEGNFARRNAAVDGLGVRRELAPVLAFARVRAKGYGDFPTPVEITPADFGNPHIEARWATLEGTVESAHINSQGVLVLGLMSAGRLIENYVRDYGSAHSGIVGARVRTFGVAKTELDIDGVPARRQLFTQALGQVRIISPAVPAEQLPAVTAAEAARAGRQPIRVRLRARLAASEDASSLMATDATGRVAVVPAPGTAPAQGSSLDVTGFAVRTDSGQVVVRNASVMQPARHEGDAGARVLRHVAEIRTLSPEAADGGIPVQVTGTVTYHHRQDYTLFVQDATGGIFVSCTGDQAQHVSAGEVVQVQGKTAAGDFAPVITAASLRAIGRGALPRPARVPLESILEGMQDSQLVEAEGIVHRIVREWNRPVLHVMMGGVRVYNPVNQRLVSTLLIKKGHDVKLAGNGREAIEMFRAGRFDVVLMDVQMPECDGLEATAAIRSLENGSSHTPIIALTAHATETDRARCIDAGMDWYVSKPVKIDALLTAMNRCCEQHSRAS